jgi:hypothetical protein
MQMASTGAAIISAQGDATSSVWAFRQTQVSGGGGSGGVSSIVAGNNVTIFPPTGLGDVTINAVIPGGAVTNVSGGGTGITVSPTTGAVIVTNTQPANTWSSYAATGAVNMNAKNLNAVANIGGVTTIQGNAGVPLTLEPASGQGVVTGPMTVVSVANPIASINTSGTVYQPLKWSNSSGAGYIAIAAAGGDWSAPAAGDTVITSGSKNLRIANSNNNITLLDNQINVSTPTFYIIGGLSTYGGASVNLRSDNVNSSAIIGASSITSAASTDLTLAAPAGQNILCTSNINMNGPGGVIFNTGGFSGAAGSPCAITAATGQNLNITASTVGMFANVDMTSKNISNVTAVTFKNGDGNVTSALTEGRNYLDINAPAAIGANLGALRLLGNPATGNYISFADNIDMVCGASQYISIATPSQASLIQLQPIGDVFIQSQRNVVINGHNTYVYGTFQAFTNTAITLDYPELPCVSITTVNVGMATAGPTRFSMGKAGTYRITLMVTINNSTLINQPFQILMSYSDVGTLPGTLRTYNAIPGVTSYVYTVTASPYAANSTINVNLHAISSGTALSTYTLGALPSADINVELIG